MKFLIKIIAIYLLLILYLYIPSSFENNVQNIKEQVSIVFNSNNHVCTALSVSGYMKGHSHGLPTEPKVSNLNHNHCIINGIYLNMMGLWVINIRSGNEILKEIKFNVH
ncbi:hypothetical protein [Vibrio paucivorans]